MILNKLNQYKNLYLQASNENAHLKHAVSKHEDELEANRKTIESMDSRILELEENQQEWDKEKAQLQSQRDCYKKERDEERESHSQTKKELAKAKEEITKLQESKEAKELSEQANVDLHSVVLVLQRRLFKTNSDASSYMKGEVEFDERRMNDMEFTDVVDEANKLASGIIEEVDQTPVDTGKEPKLPKSDKRKEKKDKEDKPKRRRNVFSIKVLDSMGIDTSNLPAGFKLIHRKDKITGEDVWIVRMYDCYAPLAGCIEYEIGRFNVPGHDPMCSFPSSQKRLHGSCHQLNQYHSYEHTPARYKAWFQEGAQYRIASGFKKENIYYLPAEDNWWGLEYGPCGPDSEMFYVADKPDCGPDCGPGCHCGKYTELGNDVFMQYEKHKDGHLTPLKQKNVDTGWGLERNLAFLNGTKDVYKTDLFAPVIAYIEQVSGCKYEADETATRSMRIVADHIRTGVMLIGDEARLTPSNVGAGYVLRRLIRRAVRHGRSLGLKKEDLLKIASIYMDEIYHESYKNLVENREFVLKELDKEIVRFESTLENGMKEFKKILDETVKSGKQTISGKDAFYLYDTFGFPIELTVEMAKEENVEADEAGFEQAMEEQKQKARENQNFSAKLTVDNDLFKELDASVTSTFAGYDALTTESEIKVIATEDKLVDKLTQGQEGTVIVPVTTFYATMGGQKGDKGQIKTENGVFAVTDTVKLPGGRIGHIGSVVSGRSAAIF